MLLSVCWNSLFGLRVDPKPLTIFKEFWTYVDQNYIYFEVKGVDWNAVYDKYAPQINENTTDEELFSLMEAALLELKDSHNQLVAPERKAERYDFRQSYEVHASYKNVRDHYIVDSLKQDGNLFWGMLPNDVGYIALPVFSKYGHLDDIMKGMKEREVKKIIIDVRGNGGGNSNSVPQVLRPLVDRPTKLGAYIEKTGPGHSDVSHQVGIYTQPTTWQLDLPVVVLINRGCYSATSYFAAMIKGLNGVTLVGQVTGGGGGGNLGFQLSNGWVVAVSVSDFVDKNGRSIELGVEPDIAIENTADEIKEGKDLMLERAME